MIVYNLLDAPAGADQRSFLREREKLAAAGKDTTMYPENYRTVLDLTLEQKDWLLNHQLAQLEHAARIEAIEKLFLIVANVCDDIHAGKLFAYLMQAIDDFEFIPLLVKEGNRLTLPCGEKYEKARQRARVNRAANANDLYPKVPPTKTEIEHWREDDISKSGPVTRPVLLETKKMMLAEIASWWRDTKDEAEADQLFQVLMEILSPYTHFGDEEKMRLEVVQQATNGAFPSLRLARCFLQLATEVRQAWGSRRDFQFKLSDVARILAIAWVRNSELAHINRRIRATQPIANCSLSVFKLIEQQACEAAAMEKAALALKETMQPEASYLPRGESIPGTIEITYPAQNQVSVSVESGGPGPSDSFNENEWHSRFEIAKKRVQQWRQEHPTYSVHLKLTVTKRYESAPSFKREQTFN